MVIIRSIITTNHVHTNRRYFYKETGEEYYSPVAVDGRVWNGFSPAVLPPRVVSPIFVQSKYNYYCTQWNLTVRACTKPTCGKNFTLTYYYYYIIWDIFRPESLERIKSGNDRVIIYIYKLYCYTIRRVEGNGWMRGGGGKPSIIIKRVTQDDSKYD